MDIIIREVIMSEMEKALEGNGALLEASTESYEIMESGYLKVNIKRYGSSGGYVVLFESSGVHLENPPTVCLSRLPTGDCWFPIDQLQAHDNHAPGWGDEAAMEIYIERVKAAIEVAAAKYEGPVHVID